MINSSMGELSCQDSLKEMSQKEEQNHKLSTPKIKKAGEPLMYKHQYIDEQGGKITIKAAGVSLHIPPGALRKRTLVSMAIKAAANCDTTGFDPSTCLTPIVSCEPDGLKFQQPVELILPHCAEFDDINLCKATARFVGGDVSLSKDSTNKQDQVRCVLKEKRCHVYTTHFSDVVVDISNCLKKRMLVVPFSGGNTKQCVKVWIINDLPSEHTILLHEQKELNFAPFNHNGRFILENQEQYHLKIQSSQDKKILTEVSEIVSGDTLFSQNSYCHQLEVSSDIGDILPLNITITVLKHPQEPVCVLKEVLGEQQTGDHLNGNPNLGISIETQGHISEETNIPNDDLPKYLEATKVKSQELLQREHAEEKRDFGTSFEDFLDRIGLRYEENSLLTTATSLCIRQIHLNPRPTITHETVVNIFLSRIMSLDYRAFKCFNEINHADDKLKQTEPQSPDEEDWYSFTQEAEEPRSGGGDVSTSGKLSCRDCIFGIILCCDPFLLQEILGKIAACQLAVPLLLPNPITHEIKFILWGLRYVRKSWVSANDNICDAEITNHPFPTMAVVRLGDLTVSKSTVINNMLGSIQGKDDHPFFLSRNQDVAIPSWSKGSLEAFWFQPVKGSQMDFTFKEATCIVNLRGNGAIFSLQTQFACEISAVTVCMVNKSDIAQYRQTIDSLSQTTKIILVLTSTSPCDVRILKGDRVIVIHAGNLKEVQIAEIICKTVCPILLTAKGTVLEENGVAICGKLDIPVDNNDVSCREAQALAWRIVGTACDSPKEYKQTALVLQKYWREWTVIDKDRSWQSDVDTLELSLSQRDHKKLETRTKQLMQHPSEEVRVFCTELKNKNNEKLQYLITWLSLILNKISETHLTGLVEKIQEIGKELKAVNTTISKIYSETQEVSSQQKQLDELKDKAKQLQKNRLATSQEFDDVSVGLEHLLREVGQLFESQSFVREDSTDELRKKVIYKDLPIFAAKLLLLGQPLEILDGDANYVPLQWVSSVLKAVEKLTNGKSRVFVISILGVQNSGKSTLLNCMFGVKFAVSAGRCTRGVFMQLLTVANDMKEEIGCDFICVVDTEGLRAPEKILVGKNKCDNELATFALCISDVTIINVGGHTVGDDLVDVLQVAAHAFIRMKEVNLRSACRVVQQNVSDPTTKIKNESASQAIFQKLDKAVTIAASDEKLHHKYRQFSDVFDVLNDKDVKDLQYIPALWRHSSAPPNCGYSEKILELKSSVLKSIKTSKLNRLSIGDLVVKIKDVWEAVTKEDFVFNFRNSLALKQYKEFQDHYQKWKMDLEKTIMLLELECCEEIRNASNGKVNEVHENAHEKLKNHMKTKAKEIQEKLKETITNGDFYSICDLYLDVFLNKLENFITMKLVEIDNTFTEMANVRNKQKEKEVTHIPKLRSLLHKHVSDVAKNLKLTHESLTIALISEEFDMTWDHFMDEIEKGNPRPQQQNVEDNIDRIIVNSIAKCCKDSNFSMYLTEMHFQKQYREHASHMDVPSHSDIKTYANRLASYLSNPKHTNVDKQIIAIKAITCQTCKLYEESNEINIPEQTFETFSTSFEKLICELITKSHPYDYAWILSFTCSNVIHSFQDSLKNVCLTTIGKKQHIIKLRNGEELPVHLSKDSIFQCMRSYTHGTIYRTKEVFNYLWNYATKRNGNVPTQCNAVVSEIKTELETVDFVWKEDTKDSIAKHFVDLVNDIMKKRNVKDEDKSTIARESLENFANKLTTNYREYLKKRIDWCKIENPFASYSEEMNKIKTGIVGAMRNVSEPMGNLVAKLLTNGLIEKFSQLPTGLFLHRAIDVIILQDLDADDLEHVLTCMLEVKHEFLANMLRRGFIEPRQISCIINDTISKLEGLLGSCSLACAILHMCAWAFPICTSFQMKYEIENSVLSQLQKDREIFLKDFKNCCLDVANDTRNAEKLCDFLKLPLIASVRNITSANLFWQLAYRNNIFISRQNLLKYIFTKLAEEEPIFEEYISFIRNPKLFTERMIREYIEDLCSTRDKGIKIDSIVSETISKVVDSLLECLTESKTKYCTKENHQKAKSFISLFFQIIFEKKALICNERESNTLENEITIKSIECFESECRKKISSLKTVLLNELDMPKEGDIELTKQWLSSLPKQLHVELGNRVKGCGQQCPFCKALCDETDSSHDVHVTELHYPAGINGFRWRRSQILDHDVCTSSVASDASYCFHCTCKNWFTCLFTCNWRAFKEYKKDFPNWNIRPISDTQATLYWKWVFAKFNKSFAKYYQCKEANLPNDWYNISREQALASLSESYT